MLKIDGNETQHFLVWIENTKSALHLHFFIMLIMMLPIYHWQETPDKYFNAAQECIARTLALTVSHQATAALHAQWIPYHLLDLQRKKPQESSMNLELFSPHLVAAQGKSSSPTLYLAKWGFAATMDKKQFGCLLPQAGQTVWFMDQLVTAESSPRAARAFEAVGQPRFAS